MSIVQAKLSVVIPVFRDNDCLARLLGQLTAMPETPDEVIVADGSGDTDCQALCARFGAHYLATGAGRGLQLDSGARAATGDWLWFLHADSTLPAPAAGAVRAALTTGQTGGWLRFRFEDAHHPVARGLACLINLRCRLGTPYGDQGLFMTMAAYRTAGGFAHEPLFEEVQLIRKLREQGRFRPLPISIGVSARRWKRDGWLRRSLANRRLAIAYMLGKSPTALARRYRTHSANERAGC